MPLAITILGVTGKMGKSLLAEALEDPTVCVIAATARPQGPFIGKDLGTLLDNRTLNTPILDHVEKALIPCSVAIDFSVSSAVFSHVRAAQEAKKPLVIGTTALDTQTLDAIDRAAQDIPILLSANFSLGVTLCLEIAALLGRCAFDNYAIDIYETHHIHKKDRPSATALALANAVGKGTIVYDSPLPRNKEDIVIHSQRLEETVGEHSLVFESQTERIELKHTAYHRKAFAQGALSASKRLAIKPAGLYSLRDLLER